MNPNRVLMPKDLQQERPVLFYAVPLKYMGNIITWCDFVCACISLPREKYCIANIWH